MLYKTLAIILLLVTITLSAQNTDTREYGFKFLQIPVNPVASGLGGTGIYASNYSGAFTLNPAANLMDERFSLSLQHCIWLVDTSCSQIVYSNGNRNKHFGLVTRILDYGQLEKRDDTGALIGNYNPLDANIMVNFAYRVMPDHMLGVNAGLLYEKIDTASSYGLSSDFGYLFLPPITNTTFFASLRNVGVTSKMENESIKLPVTFETGLSYTLPKEGYSASGQFAINKATGSDLRYTVAAELALWQTLMLRAGYKGNYDEEGLTAGLGINWHNVGIDYGWTSFSERLNDTHSFGVTYNF
jgi:hypothetical protein